jgi:hypothetical protein
MRLGESLRATGLNKMKNEEKNIGANVPITEEKKVNEGEGIHPRSNGKIILNIGQVTGIPYSKEGDDEGFLRIRIVGKTVIDGIICQVTGYITQIKEKQQSGGSATPSNSFIR